MSGNVALARVGVGDRTAEGARAVGVSRVVLLTAIVAGVALRLAPVLAADFPLNDGGMFYTMIRDLQQAGYLLPQFTSYNSAGIPFTYPPLPFYLAGVIDDLTPLSLFDVLRFVPALATVLSLGAMYLLARSFHASEAGVAASVLTFALLPDSFVWALMGGGLTRSLGMLFALLAMREAYRLYADDEARAVPWLILWSSLTVLSHLEYAWLLALTSLAFCISFCRSWQALGRSALVAFGIAACTAPWSAFVLFSHGFVPFRAALHSGYGVTSGLAVAAVTLGQAVALAAVLLVLASRKRPLFFAGWLGLIVMFNLRSLFRFGTIPLALANGEVVGARRVRPADLGARAWFFERALHLTFSVGVATVLCLEIAGSIALFKGFSHLGHLAPEERSAMAWIDDHTPPSSRFLVVGADGWAVDRAAEWFPVLANRTSVGTVQGTEWLADGAFEAAVASSEQLAMCMHADGQCLDDWSNEFGVSFTHVYVPSWAAGCCAELRDALLRDASYAPIYQGAGASIFARLPERA